MHTNRQSIFKCENMFLDFSHDAYFKDNVYINYKELMLIRFVFHIVGWKLSFFIPKYSWKFVLYYTTNLKQNVRHAYTYIHTYVRSKHNGRN